MERSYTHTIATLATLALAGLARAATSSNFHEHRVKKRYLITYLAPQLQEDDPQFALFLGGSPQAQLGQSQPALVVWVAHFTSAGGCQRAVSIERQEDMGRGLTMVGRTDEDGMVVGLSHTLPCCFYTLCPASRSTI